jgi:hypothetical protein
VWQQLRSHLLDSLHGQVQHQGRAGRTKAGQVLAGRHEVARCAIRVSTTVWLTVGVPQRQRTQGRLGDVVADPGLVEPPGLLGDRAVRAKSIIRSTTDASSSSAAPGICRNWESGMSTTACVSAPARSGMSLARSSSVQG